MVRSSTINLNYDKGPKTVIGRGRRRFGKLSSGQVESDQKDGFVGLEKKAWFFIGRVQNHVSEEKTIEYLAEPGYENEAVDVNELAFKTELDDFKSISVKVSFSKKDELYNAQFLSVKRFNFQLYEKNRPVGQFFMLQSKESSTPVINSIIKTFKKLIRRHSASVNTICSP
ncbi:hypothetical protein HHI36_013220 [Cryptolaemus montrouzieri]|uniref:Uncharacterized protein n=1 Tax=Cryptolaemus montrouzieri TaxID=559131 RepID=A0ABD2NH61_9CUCU